MKKKKCLILLAAGKINNKLPFLLSLSSNPALLPIGLKSIISYQIDFYKNKVDEIIIITNEKDLKVIQNEISISIKKFKITIFGCKTANVNQTLKYGINKLIYKSYESCIVSVITSLPTYLPKKNEVLIDKKLKIIQDWSAIKILKNNPVYFNNKNRKSLKANAFTGIFHFEYNILRRVLKKSISTDLIDIVRDYGAIKKIIFKKTIWDDVGHYANYFDTKIKYIISRSFNKIKIDSNRGILIKKSRDNIKLNNEIGFIKKLPNEAQLYFPRILKIKNKLNKNELHMDYCPYPSVSELQLFWKLNENEWSRFFQSAKSILTLFLKYKKNISKRNYLNFHKKKILKRLNLFEKQIPNKFNYILGSENFIINNKICQGIKSLLPRIYFKLNEIYNKNDFGIMHGDLCFNNILYDPFSGITRLIDARGSFIDENKISIYGDIKYDLAKLNHSAVYGYDYLISNFFNIQIKNRKIDMKIYYRSNANFISPLCKNLMTDLGFNINHINFLTGLLFLTMTPLHHENLNKQLFMFFYGLLIINKSIDLDD